MRSDEDLSDIESGVEPGAVAGRRRRTTARKDAAFEYYEVSIAEGTGHTDFKLSLLVNLKILGTFGCVNTKSKLDAHRRRGQLGADRERGVFGGNGAGQRARLAHARQVVLRTCKVGESSQAHPYHGSLAL